MSLDVMKQALEALENVYGKGKRCEAAITALRAAIEQAEKQEPVAWTTMPDDEDWLFISGTSDPNGMLDGKWNSLYTAPVDAVNIKLDHVDKTAKHEHELVELKEKNNG